MNRLASNLGRTSAPPQAETRRGQAGFTLTELMVGLVLFSFGTLGLAGMAAGLQRQTTLATMRTERNAAVITAVEQVRAADFDSLSAGSLSSGAFAVAWSVNTASRYVKEVQIVTSGPGLVYGTQGPYVNSAVTDTLDYTVVRP